MAAKNRVDSSLFLPHITAQAGRYFEELAGSDVSVELVSGETRAYSALRRYKISAGSDVKHVLVKAPAEGRSKRVNNRPLMAPRMPAQELYLREYRALVTIHDHFERLNDSRFSTIRPLDLLPEYGAFVMEEVPAPTLNTLFLRSSRLQPFQSAHGLDTAFFNAGAWLREYHAVPGPDDAEVLFDRKEVYCSRLLSFTDFLGERLDEGDFFRGAAEAALGHAELVFSEPFPLGQRLGDFGLPNMLVDQDQSIVVFDTRQRWRSAIYEDIAYFLSQLKTNKWQAVTLGLAFDSQILEGYKRAFLAGYFRKEPIPYKEIALFEILMVLDKWIAQMIAQRNTFHQQVTLRLLYRSYRGILEEKLESLNSLGD